MRARRHRRRWPTALLAGLGAVSLGGAGGIVWSIHSFDHRAAVGAARLTRQLQASARRAYRPAAGGAATIADPAATAAACSAPLPSSPAAGTGARMILSAPEIGLLAPVLAGDSATALAVGVGHLPTSAWPDQGGTDVLEAHDVTFFAGLDHLQVGDAVTLEAPCHKWTYRVTSHRVVTQGTPVPSTATPSLVMVTCWPTNALYYTKQRYVLSARLVSTSAAGKVLAAAPTFAVPSALLPAGLAPAQVSVDTLGVPEGTLQESPGLSPQLRASSAALATTGAAMSEFDAGLLAAERGNAGWWAAVAGGVPPAAAAPLAGGPPLWLSPVEVTLGGSGDQVTSATLTATVEASANRFALTVRLASQQQHWAIRSWTMQPLG